MVPLRYLVVRAAAATFIAGRLIGATVLHAQAPASELPNDLDMPSASSTITHAPAGDSALSRFRADYEASRTAPRPVFDKYLPILGPAKLLNFLEAAYPACHAQSHDLGMAIFAASKNMEVALRDCGTGCTSGCMHGVVSEAFGRVSTATIAAKMNVFCATGEMARLHKPGNCAHGLGHAIMFVTHENVGRSIDACLGFANEPMQYYCATGVYMAKFLYDRTNGGTSSSLYAPCDQESLFPAACYRYKGAELVKNASDFARVQLACSRMVGLQRRGCFHGLGYASIRMVFDNPRALARSCGTGSRDDRVTCIEGVIEKLADLDEKRARAACDFLEGEIRTVCAQSAKRKMYGLSKPTFDLYYDKDAVAERRAAIARGIP